MKNFLFLFVAVLSFNVFAQSKISEGVIIIKQTFDSDDETVKSQLAMLGDMSSTTYFKGDRSRSESSSQMTGESTVIIDQESKEMLMLMNNPMLGKVYAKRSIELTEEQLNGIVVTPVDETKTILGYECKRYDLKVKEGGQDIAIKFFMTDAIEIPTQQTVMYGDKLKGVPMYFEIAMNQMGMSFTLKNEVTEIRKEKIDDAKFDMAIPEGYTENKMLLGQN